MRDYLTLGKNEVERSYEFRARNTVLQFSQETALRAQQAATTPCSITAPFEVEDAAWRMRNNRADSGVRQNTLERAVKALLKESKSEGLC